MAIASPPREAALTHPPCRIASVHSWPCGRTTAERMADQTRRAAQRAERERGKQLAAMAKAAEEAARAMDGGDGAYDGATGAQKMALMRLRNELAMRMALPPERLAPSACAAVTLIAPTAIPAYADGVFVPIDQSVGGMHAGEATLIRRGHDRMQFASAGSRVALLFKQL